MKKLLLLTVIVGMAFLSSCKKEGEVMPYLGVDGEWEIAACTSVNFLDGEIIGDQAYISNEQIKTRYIFNADGTGSVLYYNSPDYNGWYTGQTFEWAKAKADDPNNEHGKIVFTNQRGFNPPGVFISRNTFFSETDWTIHELTTTGMAVSFTKIRNNPELVGTGHIRDERTYETLYFERIYD
jgi:hypothetical protein